MPLEAAINQIYYVGKHFGGSQAMEEIGVTWELRSIRRLGQGARSV